MDLHTHSCNRSSWNGFCWGRGHTLSWLGTSLVRGSRLFWGLKRGRIQFKITRYYYENVPCVQCLAPYKTIQLQWEQWCSIISVKYLWSKIIIFLGNVFFKGISTMKWNSVLSLLHNFLHNTLNQHYFCWILFVYLQPVVIFHFTFGLAEKVNWNGFRVN